MNSFSAEESTMISCPHVRGVGMWIEEYGKEGFNPLTGKTKMTTRKRIHVDYELPLGDEYGSFIRNFT